MSASLIRSIRMMSEVAELEPQYSRIESLQSISKRKFTFCACLNWSTKQLVMVAHRNFLILISRVFSLFSVEIKTEICTSIVFQLPCSQICLPELGYHWIISGR